MIIMWPWFQKPDSFSMAIKKYFTFLSPLGCSFLQQKKSPKISGFMIGAKAFGHVLHAL